MKLSEYINSFPRGQRQAVRERIATAIGVSEPAVRHYANGNRRCPPERWARLLQACEGKVSLKELRGDVFDVLSDGDAA